MKFSIAALLLAFVIGGGPASWGAVQAQSSKPVKPTTQTKPVGQTTRLIDLGNEACPVTGLPANPNLWVVYNGFKIRVANTEAKAMLERDPARYVAKPNIKLAMQARSGSTRPAPAKREPAVTKTTMHQPGATKPAVQKSPTGGK